ncbi:hypothetical protein AWC23_03420 [Mycobacterium saskatchewanense]|uniref:Uncharacterized protein n=1 Tax=Mycobacterium saskatchewanense TaxID=220927 RepID=A0AAJ3NUX4_9MYCO|nr:hypothetical protein AWC23_03420 [Mycobacterium saskatchewanense]
MFAGSARSARPTVAWLARSARGGPVRAMVAGSAWPTGSAGSARRRSGRPPRIMRSGGQRCGCRIGVCNAGSHTHGRGANRAGECQPADQLFQFHLLACLFENPSGLRPQRT